MPLAAIAILLLGAAPAGAVRMDRGGYTLHPVAFLHDSAPGGETFINDFEPSAINSQGELAFTADVSTGGEGVFTAKNGQITQLTRSGLPGPGGVTMGYSGELGRFGLNDEGDVGVPFTLQQPGKLLGVPAGVFRYSHNTGTLSAAAIPGTPPGARGLATGIWVSHQDGRLSKIVIPGDPAPGGGLFDDAWDPTINNAGDIASGGHINGELCYPSGPWQCTESLYLRDGATGAIRSIAHQFGPAPGGGIF